MKDMNLYRVVFTLNQPSEQKQIVSATRPRHGYERDSNRHEGTYLKEITHYNKPDVRGTDVYATSELQAISAARFELKRAIGFNADWIGSMPDVYGLHFLHEMRWDISVRKIG